MLTLEQFLPVGAPLLDFLIHDPKLEELEKYQANRGLNLSMLNEIEVRELVSESALRTRSLRSENGSRRCTRLTRICSALK